MQTVKISTLNEAFLAVLDGYSKVESRRPGNVGFAKDLFRMVVRSFGIFSEVGEIPLAELLVHKNHFVREAAQRIMEEQ